MDSFDPIEIRCCANSILGLDLTENQSVLLAKYADLLVKWNKRINLTRIESVGDVMELHLMDSLSLVRDLNSRTGIRRVLDVGSGGGLPAVPLAIMRPDLTVTMVDAVNKKVVFLRQCIALLGLGNAKAVHARIEKLSDDPYDVITSRAFASLEDIVRLTRHLLAENGCWIAMKGRHPADEVQRLAPDIEVREVLPVELKGVDCQRHLVVMGLKQTCP